MEQDSVGLVVGYFIAIFVGHFAIAGSDEIAGAGWPFPARQGRRDGPSLAAPIGAVERLLYTTALLFGQPVLIAVWLAIKTLGTAPWSADGDREVARERFLRSLMLSGVSLVWAVIGWRSIIWITADRPAEAIVVTITAFVGCIGLGFWMKRLAPPIPELNAAPVAAGEITKTSNGDDG